MALFKINYRELLDVIYYMEIQSNIKSAIDRIHTFTKSSEFEEADNISLEIKLGLLEFYFLKSMQCNDLLLREDTQKDNSKNIEDLYIEIKTELRRKLLCNSENANEQPFVTTAIILSKLDKVQQNTEFSLTEGTNLKSSLSRNALALVENIELNDDVIFNAMLEVLRRRYNTGNNSSNQSRSLAQQEANKMSHNTNPSYMAYLNEKDITEELYKNIVQETYSLAVTVSRNISSSGHGAIITSVVLRLAKESNKNLLSYAYSLWKDGERDIVEKYMPVTFKMIFSDKVTLINKHFGLALKMQESIDSDGDRLVWGDAKDKTSFQVNWELIPFWENNHVYFHLKNLSHKMFMKLEIKPDSIGDRRAFGSNDNGTTRHAWVLEPVVIDNEVLFYIFNRQFNQGLKLELSANDIGDRKLWGHNGSVDKNSPRFAWSIYRTLY